MCHQKLIPNLSSVGGEFEHQALMSQGQQGDRMQGSGNLTTIQLSTKRGLLVQSFQRLHKNAHTSMIYLRSPPEGQYTTGQHSQSAPLLTL